MCGVVVGCKRRLGVGGAREDWGWWVQEKIGGWGGASKWGDKESWGGVGVGQWWDEEVKIMGRCGVGGEGR